MTSSSYRTANRQSLQFKVRMFLRRTRTRVLVAVLQMLDGDTTARA